MNWAAKGDIPKFPLLGDTWGLGYDPAHYALPCTLNRRPTQARALGAVSVGC